MIDKYYDDTYNNQKNEERWIMICISYNNYNMNQQQQLFVNSDNELFVLYS